MPKTHILIYSFKVSTRVAEQRYRRRGEQDTVRSWSDDTGSHTRLCHSWTYVCPKTRSDTKPLFRTYSYLRRSKRVRAAYKPWLSDAFCICLSFSRWRAPSATSAASTEHGPSTWDASWARRYDSAIGNEWLDARRRGQMVVLFR